MDMTEVEYVNMLAGHDSGSEETSGVDVRRRRRNAMIIPRDELPDFSVEVDPRRLAGTLLDFESTINTKKLKVKAPFSKHARHNQGYLDDVLKPIEDVSGVLASICDSGKATFGQISSLLQLNSSLALKEDEYANKKRGKLLKSDKNVVQAKVDEIHSYREKINELVTSLGDQLVAGLADKVPPATPEDEEEIGQFIEFVRNGSTEEIKTLIARACPDPRLLAILLSECPRTALTQMSENLVAACADNPDYLQALIEESLLRSAPHESPDDYFRGASVGMNLIMAQKKTGEIADYLKFVGGDVQKLIASSSKRLEVDPGRRIEPEAIRENSNGDAPSSESGADAPLEEVVEVYVALARAVLDKLDADAVPEPICRCSGILYDGFLAKTDDRGGAREKVSSFLFIRYISPLFNADLFSNPPGGKDLTAEQRRVGILLGKILQNIGNQQPFGIKEEFMQVFNPLVEEYADAMDRLAADVLLRAGVINP